LHARHDPRRLLSFPTRRSSDLFLIVRFGDHQPMFAKKIVAPGLDDIAIGHHIDAADPRFFSTYYAIDTLNFRPAQRSSWRTSVGDRKSTRLNSSHVEISYAVLC